MEALLTGSAPAGQAAAPAADNPPPANSNPPAATGTWRDSLPEDIRGSSYLSTFSDVGSLAKSYVHAQSMIGKKGVFVPGDKASKEDWDTFYKEIGRPELDKYEFTPPKGKEYHPELVKGLKERAHQLGIMPKQLNEFVGWYTEVEANSAKTANLLKEKQTEDSINELRKEWGQGFEKQIALARLGVKEVGGDDLVSHLAKSGLSNDSFLIKTFAKVGAMLGEDKLRGSAYGGFQGKTPAEIDRSIEELMTHPAYLDEKHGDHRKIANEMSDLFKMKFQKPTK